MSEIKLEINSHYWPGTPNVREVRLKVDDRLIRSEFMDANRIHELAINLLKLADQLFEIEKGL